MRLVRPLGGGDHLVGVLDGRGVSVRVGVEVTVGVNVRVTIRVGPVGVRVIVGVTVGGSVGVDDGVGVLRASDAIEEQPLTPARIRTKSGKMDGRRIFIDSS